MRATCPDYLNDLIIILNLAKSKRYEAPNSVGLFNSINNLSREESVGTAACWENKVNHWLRSRN
jgi:hypothetical protein